MKNLSLMNKDFWVEHCFSGADEARTRKIGFSR